MGVGAAVVDDVDNVDPVDGRYPPSTGSTLSTGQRHPTHRPTTRPGSPDTRSPR